MIYQPVATSGFAPVAFPLLAITPPAEPGDPPTCACGRPECSRVGKHPAVEWRDLAVGSEVPRPAPGAGYGIKTGAAPKGSGVIVIDLDGDEALDAWDALGGAVPTRTVRTGRAEGGEQLYFLHPGFPVRNSVSELGPGIDVRGDGGFVVGPGSPHRSGATYELLAGPDVRPDPAPCPAWLVTWLQARPAPAAIQTYDGDVTDPEERAHRRDLYARYLETTPLIRSAANRGRGDTNLYEVVQVGAYDMALPTEDVLDLVREVYDPRNDRPWGAELEERVLHKAHTAKTASTRQRLAPPPSPAKDPLLASILAPSLDMPTVSDDVLEDLAAIAAASPKRVKKAGVDGIIWGAWDQPVEPVQYLVHGLIPIETVGVFVAIGSSLKSWTAVDIAVAVARGEPWLGRFSTRPGRTLIVDFEEGLTEQRRRVSLLTGNQEVDTLGIWPYPDMRIDDPAFWDALSKIPDLQLVVVDSLAAGATAVDENDAKVALPLQMAGRLAESRGTGAVFVHHANKGAGTGDDRNMMRGSTAIFAACDWAYKFENVEELSGGVRRMKMVNIKPCQGPRPAPVMLELSDERGLAWFDEDGESNASAARAALTKERTPAAIQEAIKLALAGAALETKELIAKTIGMRREQVTPQIDALLVRREVAFVRGVGYILDGHDERLRRAVSSISAYPHFKSDAALARAASVETSDVEQLIRERKIARSAEGRYIVLGAAA